MRAMIGLDLDTAAERLFPSATPPVPPVATQATPARSTPTAPAPSTTPPAAAPAAPRDDAYADSAAKLEALFGPPKPDGEATTAKPAEGAQKPAGDGDKAKPADGTDAPIWDAASPDTALAKPVAEELGLKPEAIQKLMTLREALADAETSRWEAETLAHYKTDVRAIPDARAAIRDYAPPGLRPLLDKTGLGSNKDFIAFCVNVARGQRRAPGR
jgi:hypothetical protein